MLRVRRETPFDVLPVRRVNELAFGRPAEADLVEVLRNEADPFISLVADEDGEVIGHILFTPVIVERRGGGTVTIAGLAPMAVVPHRQRGGVGSMLVDRGLDECRRVGFGAVVVLGHPEYYPRFGFVPATSVGVKSEYDVPSPAFMIKEVIDGGASSLTGVARYHSAFASI